MSDNTINPLLAKLHKSNIIPGVTFRLPSKGIPYVNGELDDDVHDGEILVNPMSTLDEIYLKTPDMLFQGTAVEKTILRCCPQVKKPLELLSKDVDYILTCMRLVSYGNILTTEYKCDCDKSKPIDVDINVSDFVNKTKNIDNAALDKLTFTIDGFLFKIRFVTFQKMIELNQESLSDNTDDDNKTPDEIFDKFIKNLTVNIENIDGVRDPAMIEEFLKNQSRKFQMAVLDKITEANNWGVKFDYIHHCKWCDNDKNIQVSLNPVSFFTEPSSQEHQSKKSD